MIYSEILRFLDLQYGITNAFNINNYNPSHNIDFEYMIIYYTHQHQIVFTHRKPVFLAIKDLYVKRVDIKRYLTTFDLLK